MYVIFKEQPEFLSVEEHVSQWFSSGSQKFGLANIAKLDYSGEVWTCEQKWHVFRWVQH